LTGAAGIRSANSFQISRIVTSRSGAGNGSGLRRMPSTIENAAVLAPIVRPSVTITVAAKPRSRRRLRSPSRMSDSSVPMHSWTADPGRRLDDASKSDC
jgi:hypothetical protein